MGVSAACLGRTGLRGNSGAGPHLLHVLITFLWPQCYPSLLVLQFVCRDTSLNELQNILAAILIILCPFGIILSSYELILVTIFHIPSAAGHHKTFNCSSHLVVVSLFYITVIFIYIRPKARYDPATDHLVLCCDHHHPQSCHRQPEE